MNMKKWQLFAIVQVVITLACLGGLAEFIRGLITKNILDIILGIATLVIFWGIYKFKPWALLGLTIFYSLNIFSVILMIIFGFPIFHGLILIAIYALIIYCFNSAAIKTLFYSKI